MSKLKSFLPSYTLAQLKNADTLSQGHTDNLKFDNGKVRVWLSRMTVGDGMPYNNQVTVEQWFPDLGRWKTIMEYEAV